MNGVESAVSAEARENVVIGPPDCRLTILPRFGGKIASLYVRGHELLQQPLAPIAPRTRHQPFDAGDASGWDECLPSVAACSVPHAHGRAPIPDHGDLWRIGAEIAAEKQDNALTLVWQCFSLPLRLERTLQLDETPAGWQLRLSYKLTNTGTQAAPWSWAAHPLFAVDPGDRIHLPHEISTLRLEGSAAGRLGKNGGTVRWPIARLADGGETDLRLVQPPQSAIGDKLFAGPLAARAGWCELFRSQAKLALRLSFETAQTPYLGLWLCYGGWPDKPGPKQMCVALEPATAPVDSLAESGPWSRLLAPGVSYDWAMTLEIKPF